MTRKQIKERLKMYGYKMIKPSWFRGDDGNCAIFIAYDEAGGVCYQFYINWETKKARKQMLSDVQVFEPHDIAYIFW